MQRVVYLRRPASGRDEQSLQQQLERVFQRQWGQPTAVLVVAETSAKWQPPADVYETAQSFVVRVELPGMRDIEIEVLLDERSLRISGYRPEPRDTRAQRYHQMGVNHGAFAIEVFLVRPVEYEGVSAMYDDGFLLVELPKPER